MVKDQGNKKVAILWENDDYGMGLRDVVDKAVQDLGGQVVAIESSGVGSGVIHEPAWSDAGGIATSGRISRLPIPVKESGLTKGKLIRTPTSRLEEAGHLRAEKTFQGKIPHTEYSLTAKGKTAFNEYKKKLDPIIRRAALLSQRNGYQDELVYRKI